MKFFKISSLLSIGFIALNTVTTSARSSQINSEWVEEISEEKVKEGEKAMGILKILSGGNPANNVPSLLPGVPTPTTAILPGVPTPKPIDTQLQVSLNSLQTIAIQNFAKEVADHLLKTYDEIVAKALVNQMFPTGKKVPDTTTTAQTTTALTVLNTLASTLGEDLKTAVITELKNKLPSTFLKNK